MSDKTYTIRQISSLPGHEGHAWQVAWNPESALLASCSTDKTIRLYSYTTPGSNATEQGHDYRFALATTIATGHTRTVRAVAWSPGGKSLAVGSFDSNVSIWERSAGDSDNEGEGEPSGEWEMVSQLEGHENECKSVAYSHGGTLLASCSRDKSVWIWEVQPDAEFECLSVMMEHTQDVKAVTFHPQKDILASASYDDTVKLYVDDPSDDWYPFATLKGHSSTVWSVTFSPCGRYLASASDDKTIRIWKHVASDSDIRDPGDWRPALDWEAHSRSVYSISWGKGQSPDLTDPVNDLGWIASAGGDGRIRIWKVSEQESGLTYTELCSYNDAHGDSELNCVSWCPRSNMHDILATAGDDGMVNVWQASQTCVYRGTPGGRCHQCVIARIACKPLEQSPATPRTLREHEVETEDKESVADSLLMTSPNFRGVSSPTPRGATSRKTSSTSTELTSSHDGRESRALRRTSKQPGRRAPLAVGASFSIDAIQVAAATSLVQDNILEPSELVELYHLFMTRWNPCVLVLDPNIHTLQYLAKSRLLLAVVSAVASQDYPAHPGLYGPLMIYARRIAADEIFSQSHEIERVQAFLLLSLFPDWNLPLEQNRSWLDLGLALDLAKRMNIDQKVTTYEQNDASPGDRNVFRTWMICHNLDIIATLQFDKPASLPGSTSPRRRVWPENTGDGSLESAVETLTVPLEHISFHLRQHSFQRYTLGADLVPGIRSGEHATSTFIVDQGVVDAMADATQRVKASLSTANTSALQRFWIHMADISTKYSCLLLLTRYSSMHKVIQDSDLHSRLLDAASAILQSYIDTAADFDCSKYAPGCFFAYGVLAAGMVSKFSSSDDNVHVTSLLDQFLTILQQSPAVARNGNRQGPFVRLTAQFRAGGMSEPGPGNVPMSTNGFPAWWKQYL